MTCEIVVAQDADALADHVATMLEEALRGLLDGHDRVNVVLTGGTIAAAIYRQFATRRPTLDTTRLDLWWGDERFVDARDPNRNTTQARAALGDVLAGATWHDIPAADEVGSAEAAAATYAREVGDRLFDLVLLGIGPDGHCASVFPRHPSATADGDVIAVHDAPKPPPVRVSLTPRRLSLAREVWFVASGESKAEAVAGLLDADMRLPCAHVRGREATRVLIDLAAQGA